MPINARFVGNPIQQLCIWVTGTHQNQTDSDFTLSCVNVSPPPALTADPEEHRRWFETGSKTLMEKVAADSRFSRWQKIFFTFPFVDQRSCTNKDHKTLSLTVQTDSSRESERQDAIGWAHALTEHLLPASQDRRIGGFVATGVFAGDIILIDSNRIASVENCQAK